jgi:radical SAM protein with 4Fe4S-binding SPASM domain
MSYEPVTSMRYLELLRAARQSGLYYPLKGLASLRARELGGRMRLLGRVGLEPPSPLELFLRVTFRCNLRCRMCGQWGESGRSKAFDKQQLKRTLDVRGLERMLAAVQQGPFPLVNIEGGEALLHPEIEAMITMLRGRGLHVKMVTNGVLLERHARWLVRQGVAALSVSIDGSAGLHDEIRGVPGTYDRVIAGLAALRDEKRRQRSSLPLVQIATTMTRHNFGGMERLCDDLGREDLGIAMVMLKHPIFIPEAYVDRHEALVRREYGAEAPSARGFLDDYGGFDLAPLRADLERVTAKRYPFEVVILPRIPPAESAKYYDYSQLVTPTRCSVPWMSPTIEPDGEVYPCNEFPDISMGNINTQSWKEIWHGEPYRRFRKLLLRGLLPICRRCCQLTGA